MNPSINLTLLKDDIFPPEHQNHMTQRRASHLFGMLQRNAVVDNHDGRELRAQSDDLLKQILRDPKGFAILQEYLRNQNYMTDAMRSCDTTSIP